MNSSSSKPAYSALNPVAESGAQLDLLSPRIEALAGKTIALLDNTKEFNRTFMDMLKERLEKQEKSVTVRRYEKLAAAAIEPDLLRKISSECNAVVEGIGD